MSEDRSRWQREFDALPSWAQDLVEALKGCVMHGAGRLSLEDHGGGMSHPERYEKIMAAVPKDDIVKCFRGLSGAVHLAGALTAPWPPPPPPAREKRAVNVVEILSSDDGGFDQPCCFGNRVEDYAVYCHNEAWPRSPSKCRRNRTDYKHEDCPGFVANPDPVRE